jgi:hypothetical protein
MPAGSFVAANLATLCTNFWAESAFLTSRIKASTVMGESQTNKQNNQTKNKSLSAKK